MSNWCPLWIRGARDAGWWRRSLTAGRRLCPTAVHLLFFLLWGTCTTFWLWAPNLGLCSLITWFISCRRMGIFSIPCLYNRVILRWWVYVVAGYFSHRCSHWPWILPSYVHSFCAGFTFRRQWAICNFSPLDLNLWRKMASLGRRYVTYW